jgi:hypothetical protein
MYHKTQPRQLLSRSWPYGELMSMWFSTAVEILDDTQDDIAVCARGDTTVVHLVGSRRAALPQQRELKKQ